MKHDYHQSYNGGALIFNLLKALSESYSAGLFPAAHLDVVKDAIGSLLLVVYLLDHLSRLVESAGES